MGLRSGRVGDGVGDGVGAGTICLIHEYIIYVHIHIYIIIYHPGLPYIVLYCHTFSHISHIIPYNPIKAYGILWNPMASQIYIDIYICTTIVGQKNSE